MNGSTVSSTAGLSNVGTTWLSMRKTPSEGESIDKGLIFFSVIVPVLEWEHMASVLHDSAALL